MIAINLAGRLEASASIKMTVIMIKKLSVNILRRPLSREPANRMIDPGLKILFNSRPLVSTPFEPNHAVNAMT